MKDCRGTNYEDETQCGGFSDNIVVFIERNLEMYKKKSEVVSQLW